MEPDYRSRHPGSGLLSTQPQRAFIDACEAAVRQTKVAPRDAEITAYVTFTFAPGPAGGSIGTRWDYGPTPVAARAYFSRGVTLPTTPIRIGGNVRTPAQIAHVDPVYPEVART